MSGDKKDTKAPAGRRLGLDLDGISTGKKAVSGIDRGKVLEAGEAVSFGKNQEKPASTAKKPQKATAAKKKAVPAKPVKAKPLLSDGDPSEVVQFNARIPRWLREGIDSVAVHSGPKWPQAYLIERMYLALCSELEIDPQDKPE